MIDSPAWRLVKALDTLVSHDGNTITIDDFAKLDFRIAKIVSASHVEGSDKPRLMVNVAASQLEGMRLTSQLLQVAQKLSVPLNESRIATSGTRREEKLYREDQLQAIYMLRRGLQQMPASTGMEWLIKRIASTTNNDALLGGL